MSSPDSVVFGAASLVVAGGLSMVIGEVSVVSSMVVTVGLSSVAGEDSVAASLEVLGMAAGRRLARKASKPGKVSFHRPPAREDQAT